MVDRARVGKSNRERGNAHELRAAKLLSAWSGVAFRRRRVTGRDDATRMVESVADVIPLEGAFRFAVECKCGRSFSMDAMLSGPTTNIFTSWLFQASWDASLATADLGRPVWPMLFFKPRPVLDWVAIPAGAVRHLAPADAPTAVRSAPWWPHFAYDAWTRCGPVAGDISHTRRKKVVELELPAVVISRWKDFAAAVDPRSAFEAGSLPAVSGDA